MTIPELEQRTPTIMYTPSGDLLTVFSRSYPLIAKLRVRTLPQVEQMLASDLVLDLLEFLCIPN